MVTMTHYDDVYSDSKAMNQTFFEAFNPGEPLEDTYVCALYGRMHHTTREGKQTNIIFVRR